MVRGRNDADYLRVPVKNHHKMAAYPSQDSRPLKKARLGPPDVYPQDPKQKEVRQILYVSYRIS